jgi:hypothetical protein
MKLMNDVAPYEYNHERDYIAKREKWNPTPEAFQAYLDRELDLCMIAIRKILRKSEGPLTEIQIRDFVALYSQNTFEEAFNTLVNSKAIKKSVVRNVKSSIEQLSSYSKPEYKYWV